MPSDLVKPLSRQGIPAPWPRVRGVANFHGDTPFVGTTDAEGNTTTNTYDVRDRLASTEDPNNIVTSYGYDENNNLRTLTDGKGATRSWTYDERNLTITKVMPDANDTVSYTYDALARLKVKTQQDSSTITMVYDLAGRMTSREYSDSTTDEFTYDEASRLLTATKGRHAITTTRTYADDGMMLSETQTLDNRTYTLQRSYDARNLVASQTFADGKVITWNHDERRLVTTAHYDGALVLTQQHDPGYRLTQQAFGNGLTRDITFNRLDNLRSTDTVRDGNTVIDELDFGYTYLADKNVEKETQANGTFEKLSFTAAYDAGNRVTSYTRDDTYLGARIMQSWAYDGAGNWNSTTIDGDTQNRTHSASDQLEVIAGDNLTYDSRGNQLTDIRDNEYEWDIDNRIVKSEGSGYSDIEYRYDALGRRIVREQSGDKEVLLWWGNTEQSEHKHQAGQTTIQNDLQANPSESALNTIFARALEGSKFEIQYFHKNYLDHVMAVSADNGNLIEHYRYTAFGEPEIYAPNGNRLATTAIDNDILWNVRRYDPGNGLYMYLYRDYDAASGRWPSRDPIGEEGGINLYGFCYNDSYGWYDYLGREPQKHDQLPPQSEIDKHGYDRSREAREKTKDSHKEIGGDAKYYRREYCGIICCKNGEVKSSKPHGGTRPTWKMDKAGMQQTGQSTCDPFFNVDKNQVVTCVTEFGEGWKFVAGYHSHTKAGGFSKKRPGENIVTDEDWASTYGDLYLGDPSGDVFRMDKKGNEFQIILDKEGNVNGVPVTK
jgi:RHS repeat-associated protein